MVGAEGLTERDYGETLKGQVCPNRPTTSIEMNFHMNILNIIRYVCLLLFLAVLSSIPYQYIRSLVYLWPFWAITIIVTFCGITTLVYYEVIEKMEIISKRVFSWLDGLPIHFVNGISSVGKYI